MLLGALALAAFDVWWIDVHRRGFPLNVDEAGYTAIAWIDYLGWETGGLDGWWNEVQRQAPTAPLLPALTSLTYLIKPGIVPGFIVLAAFAVALALAAYGIGERLAGPRLGALAALATATAPGVLLFSREYVFAVPTAALLACAVYFMLKSDGLRLRRWALACGAAVGLMLLARTMSIAFVPGLLLAGVVPLVLRARDDLLPRLLNLGLLVLTAVAVAATWYVEAFPLVKEYLTDYGYGSGASAYGTGDPLLSWGRLEALLTRFVRSDLLLPLAIVVLLALLVIAVAAVRRMRGSEDRGSTLRRLAATDATSLAIVIGAGFAALLSSENAGHGFTLPIAVLLPPLAVLALRLHPRAAPPAAAVVVLIAAVNLAAASSIWPGLSRERIVEVPAFGYLPAISGVPHTLSDVRVQDPDGSSTEFEEKDRGWPDTDWRLARLFLEWTDSEGKIPVVGVASRARALNTNTVQLAGVMSFRTLIPMSQLAPEPDDSVANYRRQLTDPIRGLPTVLLTMNTNAGDFPPTVNQAFAEAAARSTGFRMVRTMPLPNGRTLRIWRKQAP